MKKTINPRNDFTSVRHLIEWAAKTYGEDTAYSFRRTARAETEKISFLQLRDDVRALTTRLRDLGCTGRHCVLMGKFTYEWVLTYFSVMAAGGVLVPLDREWQAADLAKTAADADAAFLFCDEELADKAAVIAEHTSLLREPVFFTTGHAGDFHELLIEGRTLFSLNAAIYHNEPIDPMKLALLVFTSGTTGKGKGVMLSQNAVLSCMSDAIPHIRFGKKTVGVLPLHHTYGSTIMLLGHIMIGCEVYMSAGIRYIQKELKEQKPQHLILVPLYLETFYRRIMANIKEKGKEDLVRRMIGVSNVLRAAGIDLRAKFFGEIRAAFGGEVNMIITGGAPVNPQILEFFESIGIQMLNGYGITECAPLISVNRSGSAVPGSVGNVLEIDTVHIHEPNENGEGEIWVKGPNVMLGYYKNEQATAEAFAEGYFRTGDYGKLTRNGILFITGRKKNLIILQNGKNVYPEEIENELVAVPGIQDIIVYEGQSRRGISHNAIVAEIYPDMDYLEKNDIIDVQAHLRKYIDDYNRTAVPYKKIGVLKVRSSEFPKNTLRKIMRFQLDMTID